MDHPPFEGNVGRTPKKITESEHSRAQWFNPAQQCQVPALHGNSTSDVREKQANPGKIPHAKKYQSFSSSVEKKKTKQQDLPQSPARKSEQRGRRGVTQGWGEWPRCEQPNKHRHKVKLQPLLRDVYPEDRTIPTVTVAFRIISAIIYLLKKAL